MAWPERRETLVQQYGHAATEAGQKVREHLRKGKTADAKNCAIVAGIMTDKLLLCAGAATSRSETYSVNANAGSEQTYRDKLDGKIDEMMREIDEDATLAAQRKVRVLKAETERYRRELAELDAPEAGGGDGAEDPPEADETD
jgi:hypothetical protein